MSLVFL